MAWRWTSLVGLGLAAYVSRRRRLLGNLDYWKRESARLQFRQLRSILTTASNTQFGSQHGFERFAHLPDAEMLAAFRAAVPIADYEAFRAPIVRMREHAEPNVLWPGLVKNYAQTSGTTAGDKFMPVSDDMMKSNFKASLDIFAHASRFGVSPPSLTSGRLLFLGGSTELSTNAHGINTGDLSGIVAPLIRWPLSKVYSPGKTIALMSHWPSKIEAMAHATLHQDIRMVSGMPSWTLTLAQRVVQLAQQANPDVRTLRDVWPNFTLFVHGGVKYTPFEPRIREVWSGSPAGDDIPFRLEVYPASEGFIAMQDTPRNPGLRLLTDVGIFYEFIPLDAINDPAPPSFLPHEVELGQRYVVVMTTCAGFYRYIIGDVVEFDSRPASPQGAAGEGPARLRIVGRHKHFINAFGENIIVEHIENAVAAAASAAGLIVGEFTAAPVYPSPSQRAGLELLIESHDLLGGPQRSITFAHAFDADLKRQNVDYTTKRTDNLGMAPPTVTVVPPGTFHQWMHSRGKLGGQHKCPRCANHRDILDGARSFAGPHAVSLSSPPDTLLQPVPST